jgi:hypothetical protein
MHGSFLRIFVHTNPEARLNHAQFALYTLPSTQVESAQSVDDSLLHFILNAPNCKDVAFLADPFCRAVPCKCNSLTGPTVRPRNVQW